MNRTLLVQRMTANSPSSKKKRLVPYSPDGGWGWMVVIGTFFIHVVADGFTYSFGVLVDTLMKEFNSDNTVVALIISLLAGFTLGSGPLASWVCNMYGCRATAIIGAIIASAGCTASYFATAMWHIIVSVGIIIGIGSGLMYCPAIVSVTKYFERRRSLATGIAITGAGVGTMVFSPINQFIIDRFGWRAVFLLFTGVYLACVACGALFRPLPVREVSEEDNTQETSDDVNRSHCLPKESSSMIKSEEQNRGELKENDRSTESLRRSTISTMSPEILQAMKDSPDEVFEDAQENADNKEGSSMWRRISENWLVSLLLDPIFLLFAISNLLSSVGFNSPLYFLPKHAESGVGLDPTSASTALSAYGLSNSIGRLVFGIVSDHKLPLPYGWGNDRPRNRLWIYNISLSICGLLTAFCFLYESYISLIIYASLHGFFLAAYICLASVILVDLLGLDKLTNAFGLLLFWQGVGTVGGPPIAGLLADISDSYALSFAFSGVNLLVSGLMLFCIPYFLKKEENTQ
uniref:MFS domain-containing protein n=1 Tax=Haemonchus contortus TaxID=6289 RepID=A0A7I4YTP1_HAECO